MKKLLCMLLAALMLTALFACGKPQETEANETPATRTFTDSVGRTVEVPNEITKVAISGPLAQIVVFALCPDRLVGIASKWDKSAEQFLAAEYEVLIGQIDIADTLLDTDLQFMQVVPSHINLVGAEIELLNVDNRESVLKNCLAGIRDYYDFTTSHIQTLARYSKRI